MARDLWSTRELIRRLMARDIGARYRHSVLGYVWAILLPLATVALFTFLTSRRALPIGEPRLPYPLFALWSLAVWQLFATSLTATTQSLVNAGSLVTKASFPKEALVFAALGQPLFDFGIKVVLVVGVFAVYGEWPALGILLVPLVLAPILLYALGFGLLLSVANLVVRDVANLVSMLVTFGIFAAPVLYPPPVSYPFVLINVLNPLSPLLIATQDLITDGTLRQPETFLASSVLAILVFLVGWRVFRVVMPRVAERA
jgi:lipopolysaccharide transport system permease protein